jgi:hypothetical protein
MATTAKTAPAAPEDKPEIVSPVSSNQSAKTLNANNGPAPVGKLIVQKTIKELEAELDSNTFKSIDEFVKKHWEAKDANVLRMAEVLRMDTSEVWQVIKDLGVKLSEGL